MSEGVPIGVRNPYVAIMNNPDTDEKDYAAPVKLAKAIEIKVTPKVNSATLYADDGASETASVLGEIDVEVNIDKLTSDKRVLILGNKKDSNGVLIENSEDAAPYVAFGFQVPTSTNVLKSVWLYKGKFEPVEEDLKTQSDKVDYQTPKVKATFLKRACDGNWRASVTQGDPGVSGDVFANWFKAVYEATNDLGALTVAVTPADKATGVTATSDIKFVFNKAIKASTVNAMSVFLLKADGSTVSTTVTVSTDGKTITLHPASNLTTGTYIAVCTTGILDINNISLIQNSITTFTV